MLKIQNFSRGEKPHFVEAQTVFCGADLVVIVGGGTKYHTGAVAVAYAHPAANDASHSSTTTSLITIPGHREDAIARSAAKLISAKMNRTVTIAVGLHIDEASQKDINQLLANFDLVIKDILDSISI